MKINVISNIDKDKDWNYNRMAYALQSYIDDVVISKEPLSGKFDITHCLPYIPMIRKARARHKIAQMTNFYYWSNELRSAIDSVDMVVLQSEAFKERVVDNGINPLKIKVIRPPVDLNKFKIRIRIGVVAHIRKTKPWERNLYIKGEKELFKLFKLSSWENFQFVFAGRGWKKAWGDKYRKTGVDVHFLGDLLYQDIPKFYRGVDYLLIPSRFEHAPIVLLEALASGKPVISRRVGLAPEFKITHYDKVEELAGLLRQIEKDYIERRNQVRNLGVKEWVEKYKKLYGELVSFSENQEY